MKVCILNFYYESFSFYAQNLVSHLLFFCVEEKWFSSAFIFVPYTFS